ncbi:MAG TPA: PLP-dependent aminotransferase family protein [Burkholderiaceae bacterium]
MELHILIEGDTDLAAQLHRQIGEAIRSGRLADGQQLPPSRLLAQQLGISRKTVSEAYARLTYDKLLAGKTGKGSFVIAPQKTRLDKRSADSLAGRTILQKWNSMVTPLRQPLPHGKSRYEFLGGSPSPQHFPHDEWRRCMLHGLRMQQQTQGFYSYAEGLPALREAIARHASFSRGVVCGVHDIIVTNGAQQALDLLGRVLLEPGSVVAVEEPGYPAARLIFASQGARVIGVPVDAEGMIADRIPSEANLIYTTPAHQFPLGMAMSLARREALLEKAKAIGAIIIEDDYDSAFRYEGRPTDSLQSMDRHGMVCYVGSFSKVMLPELRIGYLIAPPAVLNPLQTAKHLSDWHTGLQIQHALTKFIDDGYLQKHIRRCHQVYAGRREKLLQMFAGPLADWFELVPISAGFHLAALARREIDIGLLIKLARRVEVGLHPLRSFYHGDVTQDGLFFGYGAIETLDIEPALLRVRDILLQM